MCSITWSYPEIGLHLPASILCSTSRIRSPKGQMWSDSNRHSMAHSNTDRPEKKAFAPFGRKSSRRLSMKLFERWPSIRLKEACCWWEWGINMWWHSQPIRAFISPLWLSDNANCSRPKKEWKSLRQLYRQPRKKELVWNKSESNCCQRRSPWRRRFSNGEPWKQNNAKMRPCKSLSRKEHCRNFWLPSRILTGTSDAF